MAICLLQPAFSAVCLALFAVLPSLGYFLYGAWIIGMLVIAILLSIEARSIGLGRWTNFVGVVTLVTFLVTQYAGLFLAYSRE